MEDFPRVTGYLPRQFCLDAPLNNGANELKYYLFDHLEEALLIGVYEDEMDSHSIINDNVEKTASVAIRKISSLLDQKARSIRAILCMYIDLRVQLAYSVSDSERLTLEVLFDSWQTVMSAFGDHYLEVEIRTIEYLFDHVADSAESNVISAKLTV